MLEEIFADYKRQPGCHHDGKEYLIELKELLLLPQGVCGCAGMRRGLCLRGLRKAVVAIRVRPLQDSPAVHHLKQRSMSTLRNV